MPTFVRKLESDGEPRTYTLNSGDSTRHTQDGEWSVHIVGGNPAKVNCEEIGIRPPTQSRTVRGLENCGSLPTGKQATIVIEEEIAVNGNFQTRRRITRFDIDNQS